MPAAPFHAKIADMPRESIADGALTRTAARTDDAIVTFNWIRPGELLYIPAGTSHVGRVVGDEVVLNVDVFAPIRADYLYLAAHQDAKEGSDQ